MNENQNIDRLISYLAGFHVSPESRLAFEARVKHARHEIQELRKAANGKPAHKALYLVQRADYLADALAAAIKNK
jgi:hypothetical protein